MVFLAIDTMNFISTLEQLRYKSKQKKTQYGMFYKTRWSRKHKTSKSKKTKQQYFLPPELNGYL